MALKITGIPTGTYVPTSQQTQVAQTYRGAGAVLPQDLSSSITPSVDPWAFTDGLTNAFGFDQHWLVIGEDGQMHVISKMDRSAARVDRAPNWSQADIWNVSMATLVSGYDPNKDSPNPFLRGIAAETWTYADPGPGTNVTTGYCIVVGSGDKNGSVYRPPTVYFWREGQAAAQSLNTMLDNAGIMGGSYATPRCLQGVARTALNTFYVCGSGQNQSTNPDNSRPTFGKMVLTLNGSESQTGPTAVSSLTWADYTATLQGVMPAGETLVNVPAIADQLLSGVLYVMCITVDGSNVYRARLVQFTDSNQTAALDALNLKTNGSAAWPLTPPSSSTIQVAQIKVGANGIFCSVNIAVGGITAYYRGTAETTWRPVTNQINRAFGANGVGLNMIRYCSARTRWEAVGGFQNAALAGWFDVNFKEGHPLSMAFPVPERFPNDNTRQALGLWSDATGALVAGARQLCLLVPGSTVEQSPIRVLWGLRVTPTASNDQIQVSEGEVLIYQYNAPPRRVYLAGGTTLGSLTSIGAPYSVVITTTAAIQRPGNGWGSGTDYPEPALFNQAILATITRTANGVPITTAEIDQTTYRDQ